MPELLSLVAIVLMIVYHDTVVRALVALGVLLAAALLLRGLWHFLRLVGDSIAAARAQRVAAAVRQLDLYDGLVSSCELALQALEAMPEQLARAHALLDAAEREFADGAFSPFWDSVEEALAPLRHFEGLARSIGTYAQRYAEDLPQLEQRPPPRFPVDPDAVRAMLAANTAAGRMRAIVRAAQRDFHFATIFEQRRTTASIIEGFRDLRQAVDSLGDRIVAAVEGLGKEIAAMAASMEAAIEEVGQSVRDFHGTYKKEAADRAERRRRATAGLRGAGRRR